MIKFTFYFDEIVCLEQYQDAAKEYVCRHCNNVVRCLLSSCGLSRMVNTKIANITDGSAAAAHFGLKCERVIRMECLDYDGPELRDAPVIAAESLLKSVLSIGSEFSKARRGCG